jgi:hypothetical protein
MEKPPLQRWLVPNQLMIKDDSTHTPTPSATDYPSASREPIELPAHLHGAELCRYVLEEASRRRALDLAELEARVAQIKEAERLAKLEASAELEPLRPKPEPIPSQSEPQSTPEADPGLLNEWEI